MTIHNGESRKLAKDLTDKIAKELEVAVRNVDSKLERVMQKGEGNKKLLLEPHKGSYIITTLDDYGKEDVAWKDIDGNATGDYVEELAILMTRRFGKIHWAYDKEGKYIGGGEVDDLPNL